ncbi:hypothetical protein [Xenophilus sp. Marseille-Q4582]|uniref:hypothetical protein n=1 Tax=Xenophilus sp. Marseille-Q4582 TaxID=2866600 RepID=UPI001CE40EEA|nr:hypothetical protein [Xenophilus sp. Marseille-Q4582]
MTQDNASEFKLSIDITVTGLGDRYKADVVNDVLQELTNRIEFRNGTIQPGRVIDHRMDHNAVRVTVDLNRLTTQQLTPVHSS